MWAMVAGIIHDVADLATLRLHRAATACASEATQVQQGSSLIQGVTARRWGDPVLPE